MNAARQSLVRLGLRFPEDQIPTGDCGHNLTDAHQGPKRTWCSECQTIVTVQKETK